MKRLVSSLGLFLAVALLVTACSTVPITGRSQLSLVPDSQVLAMSFTEYDSFLAEHKVVEGTAAARQVKTVGEKIEKAVVKYFTDQNQLSVLNGFAWEFHLVEDTEVNAWCMPGGKVVFYTGILPYTKDENGMAVVMGHEIAHAVCRHGNERLSQQLLVNLGGMALDQALSQKSEKTQQIWATAFGLGAQVGYLLPYSRTHENEADRLGMIFMAMAGYDPNGAVAFWQRMAQKGGGSMPEFLSTHPSDETRIANMQKIMPEALSYYKK